MDPGLNPVENAQPEGTTSRKRKRIPVACSSCRTKKSRCDGQRPKCTTCSAQGLHCVYANEVAPGKSLVPKSFLDDVESRLGFLEDEYRQLKSQLSECSSKGLNEGIASSERHTGSGLGGNLDTPSIRSSHLHTDRRSPNATDGVGTVEFTNEETQVYFGPSSNIAFTRLVRLGLARIVRETQGQFQHATSDKPVQGNNLAVSRPPSPVADFSSSWPADRSLDAAHLPPRTEVLPLVQQFFSNTGILFPYISEKRVLEAYEMSQEEGGSQIGKSWLALLYMILAMAISTSTANDLRIGERYVKSEMFFVRAKSLCIDTIMADPVVEAVQAMLLMSQYLQGTQRSLQTWSIHGLAVKVAFQLGMHSRQTLEGCEPLERETRLRTWYGCVILDRTLSTTFGRPPSIPPAYVHGFLPQHLIQYEVPVPWSKSMSSTEFWNATIKLYAVHGTVIQELYGNNLGHNDAIPIADLVASVFRTEQQLSDWKASIPPSLQPLVDDDIVAMEAEEDILSLKLRVILTLRYHALRILLHRPVLDRHLRVMVDAEQSAAEVTALMQFGQLSMAACSESAQAVIGIVGACTAAHGSSNASLYLGAWWFSLYYTFNAAITITAILVVDHYQSQLFARRMGSTTNKLLDTSLETAVQALTRLDHNNPMIEKCIKFIATLRFMIQESLTSRTSNDTQGPSLSMVSMRPNDFQASVPQRSTATGAGQEWDMPTIDFLPSEIEFQSLDDPVEFLHSFGNGDLLW